MNSPIAINRLRIILVDDTPARASLLEEALAACGHRVLATLPSASGLLKQVECQRPDAVIVDLESPDRDVLEAMSLLNHHQPLPVLMFAASDDPEQIQRAVKAGVSAYIVDGLASHRVRSLIDVAIARFHEYQALRQELADARQALAGKDTVERAKQLLMRHRQLNEDDAHRALQKLAMERGRKLVAVAREVVDILQWLEREPSQDPMSVNSP